MESCFGFFLYPECNQPVAAVDTGERDGANEEGLAARGQWTVDSGQEGGEVLAGGQ